MSNVKYLDAMPAFPKERGKTTFVPVDFLSPQDRLKVMAEVPWNPKWDGLSNQKFGEFRLMTHVTLDEKGNIVKPNYQAVIWNDGPIDPRTRLATPGAVTAPVEYRNGKYYVHFSFQWREAPWDGKVISVPSDLTDRFEVEKFIAENRGLWVATTPGGFADFVGESPEAVAKREAIEEGGIEILSFNSTPALTNRANVATLVSVGYSAFKIVSDKLSTEAEKLLGNFAVPIDRFISTDDLVDKAVTFALRDLGKQNLSLDEWLRIGRDRFSEWLGEKS